VSCQSRAEELGITLLRVDRTSLRTANGKPIRFFEFGWRHETGRQGRSILQVKWHTKAGAWQAAYRWAKTELE